MHAYEKMIAAIDDYDFSTYDKSTFTDLVVETMHRWLVILRELQPET